MKRFGSVHSRFVSQIIEGKKEKSFPLSCYRAIDKDITIHPDKRSAHIMYAVSLSGMVLNFEALLL